VADLTKIDLTGAHLEGANLNAADLSFADLRRARNRNLNMLIGTRPTATTRYWNRSDCLPITPLNSQNSRRNESASTERERGADHTCADPLGPKYKAYIVSMLEGSGSILAEFRFFDSHLSCFRHFRNCFHA
jgi:uncharacterized protein YjbI with pentapeptide repeats